MNIKKLLEAKTEMIVIRHLYRQECVDMIPVKDVKKIIRELMKEVAPERKDIKI